MFMRQKGKILIVSPYLVTSATLRIAWVLAGLWEYLQKLMKFHHYNSQWLKPTYPINLYWTLCWGYEHDAEIIWNRVGVCCFGHNEFLVKRMCAFKIMGLIFLSSLIKLIKLLIKLKKRSFQYFKDSQPVEVSMHLLLTTLKGAVSNCFW